jgi:hypothetical protein
MDAALPLIAIAGYLIAGILGGMYMLNRKRSAADGEGVSCLPGAEPDTAGAELLFGPGSSAPWTETRTLEPAGLVYCETVSTWTPRLHPFRLVWCRGV